MEQSYIKNVYMNMLAIACERALGFILQPQIITEDKEYKLLKAMLSGGARIRLPDYHDSWFESAPENLKPDWALFLKNSVIRENSESYLSADIALDKKLAQFWVNPSILFNQNEEWISLSPGPAFIEVPLNSIDYLALQNLEPLITPMGRSLSVKKYSSPFKKYLKDSPDNEYLRIICFHQIYMQATVPSLDYFFKHVGIEDDAMISHWVDKIKITSADSPGEHAKKALSIL